MSADLFAKRFKKLDLQMHGVRLPEVTINPEDLASAGVTAETSHFDYLYTVAKQGLQRKVTSGLVKKSQVPEYEARIKREMEDFRDMGFVDYVLMVFDVTNYCDKIGIQRGYGRGSAAGSLVFYLLGVTDIVDPLKYHLFFERFVSKSRAKKTIVDDVTYLDGSLMCDVDLDVDYARRGEVVAYINQKYPHRVSKIMTLNTLTGKILIKECGKIIGEYDETTMGEVVDLIPKKSGFVADIEDATNEDDEENYSPKFKEWCDANPRIYNIALKLRDLIRNKGSHASGYLICYDKLEDMMPLELTSDKELVCSYDMKKAALISVKLDVLGLRCCSVISEVVKLTGVDISKVNVNDDPLIYDNLQNLRTPHGIFQIEADTNLQVCQAVKPKNLGELSDILAIARPGALSFLHDYVDLKAELAHPVFGPILSPTRNLCLYQEQMMQMAHAIGFTLDEAEILRRIVGKKEKDKAFEWQAKITAKCEENGFEPRVGELLWKILEASAKYSFNKSHSAAYGAMSALTTYLKFKYPKEFFLALFRLSRFEPNPLEEIQKISKELGVFGIKLLPPHLIKSKLDFEIEGDNIRYGLLAIKGISDKSIEKLTGFRTEFTNKFQMFAAAKLAGLPIGITSALIQAGALDDELKTISRSRLVLEAQTWNIMTEKEQRLALQLGEKFNFDLLGIIIHLSKTLDEKGKNFLIKESRFETIKKKYEPYKQIYNQNRQNEEFASWFYERQLLGYSHSQNLVHIFRKVEKSIMGVKEARDSEEGESVTFVGVVAEVYQGVARNEKKTKYLKIAIEDETSKITAMAFDAGWNKKIEQLKDQGEIPEEGDIVVVYGKKKKDATVFLDRITRQTAKAYLKFSEMKERKSAEKAETK